MKFSLNQHKTSFPETLVLPLAKDDEMDSSLLKIHQITRIPVSLLRSDFKAEVKEIHTLYYDEHGQNKRIVLLGLGENPGIKDVTTAFRAFIFRRKANLVGSSLGVSFQLGNTPADPSSWIEGAINGILLGKYDIGLYKTEPSEKPVLADDTTIDIVVDDSLCEVAERSISLGRSIAETQLEMFNLVNAPSNKKTPRMLADWAVRSGKKYGYDVKVLDQKEIEAMGLHALLAVNRGSENPPAFIIMEYKPSEIQPVRRVGLVGKGVTFDTGGLSIKPSANMHLMKSDMGGAAAVMGTMEVAAKLKLPFHIMAIVPATENSVDSLSIKPGDVIGSYDGKTIEVIDTDAEGRLILADGLAYICRHFKPDILIDLATLTGSCIRALGTYAGGLFSNNDELACHLLEAGQSTGERLWQLPIWADYRKEMDSDVADIKNFSGNPSAGAITAAKFLEAFTQDHPVWAHMDIAGVAVGDSEFSSQKSATAFGVRLLTAYLQKVSKEGADENEK